MSGDDVQAPTRQAAQIVGGIRGAGARKRQSGPVSGGGENASGMNPNSGGGKSNAVMRYYGESMGSQIHLDPVAVVIMGVAFVFTVLMAHLVVKFQGAVVASA